MSPSSPEPREVVQLDLSTGSTANQLRGRELIRRELERYVYVIQFTSGTLKVGQTGNPQKRIKEHSKAAQAHGHSPARTWVSAPHVEYASNEAALIAFCEGRWTVAVGREAFEAGDFDAVVEHAKGLPYGRVPAEELVAQEEQRVAIVAGAHAAFDHKTAMAKLGELADKARLIASLVNDENRWVACDAFYELAKEAVSLTPAPWAAEDPTAAERYLAGRGTAPELARKNAAEFELNFRTLYAIEFLHEAEAFEDIARFCDSTAGPVQGEFGGAR